MSLGRTGLRDVCLLTLSHSMSIQEAPAGSWSLHSQSRKLGGVWFAVGPAVLLTLALLTGTSGACHRITGQRCYVKHPDEFKTLGKAGIFFLTELLLTFVTLKSTTWMFWARRGSLGASFLRLLCRFELSEILDLI